MNPVKRKDITDKDVCLACWLAHTLQHEMSYKILEKLHPNAPIKVLYAAMKRASERGLIEYGVSLRSAWVTDKGEQLIMEGINDE